MGRPETGVMQFGNDWPGVFIRGDNAAGYAIALRTHLTNPGQDAFAEMYVKSLLELLEGSNVQNNPTPQMALLVEEREERLCAHPSNE